jgi:parallel beta-helix repeat protein
VLPSTFCILHYLAGVWLFLALNAEAKVLTVSVDGKGDFQRIQAAIDAAKPGDTIQATPGTYQEALIIKKEIFLKGAGADTTRIEYGGEQMVVQVQSVKNGEISGFTIAYIGGGQRSTLWLSGSNITLTDNIITGGFFSGVSLTHGSDAVVSKNHIENNRRNGVQISGAIGRITENVIRNNGQNGVRVVAGMSPTIKGNEIYGNQRDGVQITDGSTALVYRNRVFQNKLNGVYIDMASTVAVRENRIEDNAGSGVVISSESAGEIWENVCARNEHHGVVVREHAQPEIIRNTIVQNQQYGIVVYDGATPVIQNNIAAYNQVGVVADIGMGHTKGDPYLDGNNIWKNRLLNYQAIDSAPTDLSLDPRFVDMAAGDYRLMDDSPMIGATSDERNIGALPSVSSQMFVEFDTPMYGRFTLRPYELRIGGSSAFEKSPSTLRLEIVAAEEMQNQPYLIEAGRRLQLRITAPRGQSISHSSLPSGATYTPETGLFQWTPERTQPGEVEITFSAKAESGQVAERTVKLFVWKRNRPPQMARINGRELRRYESPTYEVRSGEQLRLTFEAEDADNDPLMFSAINPPPGARMEGGLLTWNAQLPQSAELPILVVVSDGQEIDAVDVMLRVGD